VHASLEEAVHYVNCGPDFHLGTVIQDVIDSREGMRVCNSVFVKLMVVVDPMGQH